MSGNPNAELIAVMGKKAPDPAHFKSVINLHDKTVKTGSDRAIAYAKRAITIALGVHTRELQASETKKCRADIDAAIKINKNLPVVQIAEGCYYYYCLRNYKKAITHFSKAFKEDPENYKPLFYMAMVYKTTGDWTNVRSLLDELSKFKITNPLGLTNIGLCYDYLHDFKSALDCHEAAIQINPDWWAGYMNKFKTLLLKNEDTKEARRLLKSLITKSEEEHLEYQIVLDIYDGKYSDAFKKATNGKPRDFDVKGERYVYLGNISMLLGNEADAQKYFNAALKKLNLELPNDPDNTDIHSYIGLIHAVKGNNKDAIAEAKRSVAHARKIKNQILESEMIINMAKIYTILKMYDEAIDLIEDVLSKPSLFSTRMLIHDPVWKPLLNDTKLKAIIKKY